MKDFIQPIIELVKTILQREKGTKFLVTLAVIGAIVYLALQRIDPIYAGIIGVLGVVYFIADVLAKKPEKPKKEEKE